MQGTTKSGYQYNIDDRILKDWRFVTALTKCQQSKTPFDSLEGVQEMTRLLFGDKFDEYMQFISSRNDGFCPSEVIMEEVKGIFESAALKN